MALCRTLSLPLLFAALAFSCAPKLEFVGKRCDDGYCPGDLLCSNGVCLVTECDDAHGLGAACTMGEGACRQSGTQRCESRRLVCTATPLPPGEETCNGVDDNCNGVVDDAPGCVATLVGEGPPGFLDGPGSAAQYARPLFLEPSPDGGELYVADSYNHAIRRVSRDGTVVTVAGQGRCGFRDGPLSQALFCEPVDVAVARDGTLFVSDRLNNRIRKIQDGAVTTLVGGADAGYVDGYAQNALLNHPEGIDLLDNGDLLIADSQNDCIRRYVANAGWIRTEAGPFFYIPAPKPDAGPPDAGPPDAGPKDAGLPDAGPPDAGPPDAGPPDAGPPDAGTPDAGVPDAGPKDAGTADAGTVDAGSKDGGSDGGGGNLWFLASDRMDAGFLDVAPLVGPSDVRECCGGGRMLVTEAEGHRVRSIPFDGGLPLVLVGDPDGGRGSAAGGGVPGLARLDTPRQLWIQGAIVYVADSRNHRIAQFNTSNGVAAASFGITAGIGLRGFENGFSGSSRFDFPVGLARFGEQLIVADANHRLRGIAILDTQRVVSDFSGGPHRERFGVEGGVARLRGPRAPLVVPGRGLVWVEPEQNVIRSFSVEQGMRVVVSDLTALSQPPVDGTLLGARLFGPEDLTLGADGKLYLADLSSHSVRAIDLAASSVTTLAGDLLKSGVCCDGGTLATSQLSSPAAVAFGSSDAGTVLYIADRGNAAIRRVVLGTGKIYLHAGGARGVDDGTPGKFMDVGALAVTEDGVLYVADTSGSTSRIRRVTVPPTGNPVVSTAFSLPFAVSALASYPPGRLVAVGGTKLLELTPRDGGVRALSDISPGVEPGYRDGPLDSALFWDLSGVLVLPDQLLVSDRGAQRIRRVWLGDAGLGPF